MMKPAREIQSKENRNMHTSDQCLMRGSSGSGYGYFIGNLFYLFFGFLLLMKTLKFLDIYYPLIIYLAFLSTLVHFSTTRFLMSHVGEFFISSVLIYLFFTKKILHIPKALYNFMMKKLSIS